MMRRRETDVCDHLLLTSAQGVIVGARQQEDKAKEGRREGVQLVTVLVRFLLL